MRGRSGWGTHWRREAIVASAVLVRELGLEPSEKVRGGQVTECGGSSGHVGRPGARAVEPKLRGWEARAGFDGEVSVVSAQSAGIEKVA